MHFTNKSARSDPTAPACQSELHRVKSARRRCPVNRCFESLWRHLCNRTRTRIGVAAGSSDQSGPALMTAASVSVTVSPRNTIFPVSISYSTQPNAQMSARRSTGLPFACSDDIYAAVPGNTRACVAIRVIVGELKLSIDAASPSIAFAKPKIQDLHDIVARHLHVRGFQVAMHDPSLVRVLEPFGNLLRDGQCLLDGNRAGMYPISKCRTFDQFRDERMSVAGVFQTVDRSNIGMIEGCEDFRFALETCHARGVSREGFRQDFQRDVASKLRIARAIDLTHSSRAERRQDCVGTEAIARDQRHLGLDYVPRNTNASQYLNTEGRYHCKSATCSFPTLWRLLPSDAASGSYSGPEVW